MRDRRPVLPDQLPFLELDPVGLELERMIGAEHALQSVAFHSDRAVRLLDAGDVMGAEASRLVVFVILDQLVEIGVVADA
jgi:hypothetical protein